MGSKIGIIVGVVVAGIVIYFLFFRKKKRKSSSSSSSSATETTDQFDYLKHTCRECIWSKKCSEWDGVRKDWRYYYKCNTFCKDRSQQEISLEDQACSFFSQDNGPIGWK